MLHIFRALFAFLRAVDKFPSFCALGITAVDSFLTDEILSFNSLRHAVGLLTLIRSGIEQESWQGICALLCLRPPMSIAIPCPLSLRPVRSRQEKGPGLPEPLKILFDLALDLLQGLFSPFVASHSCRRRPSKLICREFLEKYAQRNERTALVLLEPVVRPRSILLSSKIVNCFEERLFCLQLSRMLR